MSQQGPPGGGGGSAAVVVVTLVLVLWTVSSCVLWSWFSDFRAAAAADAKAAAGAAPGAPPAPAARKPRALLTPAFSACGLVFLALSAAAVACVAQLRSDVSVFVYDPWRDLELPPNTWDGRTIKGAYRKLSMQHHPDRGGDPKRFQAVSRAHFALTDDAAKRNFLERGNPEGTFINMGELPAWLPTDPKALAAASFALVLGALGAVGYAGFAVVSDRPRANKAAGFVSDVDKLAGLTPAERKAQRKAARLNYENGRVPAEQLRDFLELLDEADARAAAADAKAAAAAAAPASAGKGKGAAAGAGK